MCVRGSRLTILTGLFFMYGSVRKNGRIFINKGNSSLSDSISYIELRFESECYRLLLNAEAVKECSMMFTLVISN